MRRSKTDFIREQGFEACGEGQFAALMFQPRVVGALAALGVIVQTPWIFLALSTMLWWSVLAPHRNPFDAVFNQLTADSRLWRAPVVAPPPRRFAQAMAATLSAIVAMSLFAGAPVAAWLLEGLFMGAATAVIFRRACAGASLYNLLWPGTPPLPCAPLPGASGRIEGELVTLAGRDAKMAVAHRTACRTNGSPGRSRFSSKPTD